MPFNNIQPVGSQSAARYKYYTVDIVSNTVIGEIPFEDVNYERSLKAAGSFSGKITTSQDTENLDLYNSTMPGKTALYVVRNEECVWGGIIWGRTYDMLGRSLSISASEFTSYLSHRLIWKTNTRSFTANLVSPSATPNGIFRVNLTSGSLREPLAIFDSEGVRNTVYVTLPESSLFQYNGYYEIVGTGTSGVPEDPTTSSFYVRIPNLPVAKTAKRTYYDVSVTTKADTYEYIRSMITEAFSDFSEIDFANEIIEPGVKVGVKVLTKKLEITDSTHGVATFTTDNNHELIVGEEVIIANVDPLLDGAQVVSEVPSKKSFKIKLDNPVSAYNKNTKLTLSAIPVTDVVSAKSLIQRREKVFNTTRSIKRISRVNGVVTIILDKPHTYARGQKVSITIPKKAPWKKTIDGKETDMFNYSEDTGFTITSVDLASNSFTYNELESKYNSATYNIAANVPTTDKAITNVKLSTPETKLRLTPLDGVGFVRGDYVKVSGVDDLEWPRPLYNGFVTVDESSYGLPNPISMYQLTNSLDGDFGILSLYFSNMPDTFDDPNAAGEAPDARDLSPLISTIEPLADVLITGLDPRFDNQVWQASDGAFYDGPSQLWRVNFIVPYLSTDPNRISAPTGAFATVNGTKWFEYYPAYSSATSTDPEPDAVSGISAIQYLPPTASQKYGKLTIFTNSTHKYNIGDGIAIAFADDATKKSFDGTRTVIAVGADDDGNSNSVSFNYVVPSTDPPQAIKTRTTKSGTLTRRSALLTPPKIESAAITDISTEGTLATVKTYPSHPFTEGDYVVISTPVADYASFTNQGEPVKIVSVPNEFEFQYITTGKAEPKKIANVKAINTSTDGSTMTITTGGVADQVIAPRTYNITNITNSADALSLAFITLSANHGADPGESVTVAGLPAATYSTPTNIPAATRSIVGIVSSYGSANTLTITFGSSHGWSRSDIDKYPNITISGLSTSSDFTYWDQKTFPAVWRRSQSSVVLQATGTRASITSNVVTMWTSTAHGFKTGDSVFVDGLFPFHGTYTITSTPSTNTFTYSRTTSNRALAGTYAVCTATRLFDIKMNLGVYNGTYKVFDIPSSNQIVVEFTPRSSIPDWWISSGDASGSVSFPAVTGIANQLTPNYALLNGITSVYDVGGPTALNKLFLISNALEANKEIINGNPGAGTITFAGRVKSIANATPHGLQAGDLVNISGIGGYYDTAIGTYVPLSMVNANHTILSVTDTTFTITSPLSKAVNGYTTYFVNKEFAMDEFTSGVVARPLDVNGMIAYRDYRRTSPANVKRITSIARSSDGAGATVTAPGHGLSDDDIVYINAYGSTGGVFNQGNTPITIANTTADTFTYDFYPVTNIDRVSVFKNKATLYTAYNAPHRFFAGDTVTLSNFPSGVYGTAFNGNTFVIQNVGADRIIINTTGLADRKNPITLATYGQVEFASGGIRSVSSNGGTVTVAPTASKEPVVFRKTYGGFPRNADMGGIEFSTENYSTYKQASETIRGSQLVNLGGHLEQYSSSINGFDYRIDCKLYKDPVTGTYKFKRIFTLVPILPATYTAYLESLNYSRQDPLTLEVGLGLAPGQVADPSAFGADKIVFEYPGNISNVSLSESSESAATRVFIYQSSGGDGGGSVRYSAASATDLLADGWPLLDRAESQSWPLLTAGGAINTDNWGNYDVEIDLYKTAKRFLYESKPPIGDFVITVNGSMNPVVGTFNPGDWCSLNINDAFVKSRLASALELRKNVIVRKIDTISVTVPNNPAFPEQVNLTLVTDWQVDKVGE